MRRNWFIVFYFLLASLILSQNKYNQKIIEILAKDINDTSKTDELQNLIEEELESDVWMQYNTAVIDICLKNKPKNNIEKDKINETLFESYLNNGTYYKEKGQVENELNNARENIRYALNLKSNEFIGRAYRGLGIFYARQQLKDSAILNLKKAVRFFKLLSDKTEESSTYNQLAICYELFGQKKEAELMYLNSVLNARTINNIAYSEALTNYGVMLSEKGSFQAGIDTLLKALNLIENEELYSQKSNLLTNIAQNYGQLSELDKQFYYYNLAEKSAKKSSILEDIAKVSSNYAAAIFEDAKKSKNSNKMLLAIAKTKESIQSFEKIHQTNYLTLNYYNLCRGYQLLIELDKSKLPANFNLRDTNLKYIQRIASNNQEAPDNFNSVLYYSLMGDNEFKYGYLHQSVAHYEKACRLAEDLNIKNLILNCYTQLITVYEKLNERDKLLKVYKKTLILKDSLFKNDLRVNVLKSDFKYQEIIKTETIKQLEQKNQITTLQSKQKSIILYCALGLVIVIVLLSYILFTRYKTSRQNESLKQQLQAAESLRKSERRASESEIKAIKSQMNPHFFYNALNSIQGFMYSGDKEKAAQSLGLFSDLSRSVLESSRNTEISLHDEIELLENYLKLETMRLPKIKYHIHTSENLNLHDTYLPSMILQPLVENSIKHGLANKSDSGKLDISFTEKQNRLYIVIEDAGIGRAAANEMGKRLIKKSASFSTEANHSRIELLNENRTEKITQAIIDKMDETGKALGTIVKLSIPINNYD